MKRKAVKIIMFLIMAFSMPLLFVACNKEPIRLERPEIALVQENNEIIIKCKTINNSNGYCFEVNGVPFITPKTSFNLSEVMAEYKTYIIKAYAIGSGNYINSKTSNIISYKNEQRFATPILNINDTLLSWTNIDNAQGYYLRVNNSQIIEFNTTQVDIKENEDIFNAIDVNKNNTFEVKVKATDLILESNYSNIVNYSEATQLISATNLITYSEANKVYLSWQSNYEQISYKVYLNNTEIAQTTNKYLDITEFLTEAKNYVFAVECVSDSSNVKNSEKSEICTYENYIQLTSPQISEVYVDDENNIIVEWNKPENAISYEILLNETDSYQVYAEKHVIKFEQAQVYAQDEIIISVKATGYNNFTDSEYSSQVGFNPYKTLQAPQNLKTENILNKAYLSFTAVENAKLYTISIDGEEFVTEKTYIELSNYVNETKQYEIKVKCNSYNFFKESLFSDSIEYYHTYALNEPCNVKGEIINEILTISWDREENAQQYSVEIIFENASIITLTTENYYEHKIYSGGEYSFSVKALGDNVNYFDSDFSEKQKIKHIKQINSPSNFKYEKDNSYLTLSWDKVSNSQGYELTYNNKTIKIFEQKIKILLSEFNKETYIFTIKAIAISSEYYLDSLPSTLTYEHGSSVNVGELFYVNDEFYDFNIESYEELTYLVEYAYLYNKENVSFYANFNYSNDLTAENYYSEYKNIIDNYNKSDETIRNEVISSIIKCNAQDDMQIVSIAKEATKVTLTFEFANKKSLKTVSSSSIAIDKQFTAYKNGSKTSGLYCESLTVLPEANNLNNTMQILMVLNQKKKPQFETSIKGVEIAEYYNDFISILNSNISKSATTYQKVLAMYDYLMANTAYDFACEEYVTNNNVNYEEYYSYNIDGVAKYSKATSVGLAKTFALMCLMEGIEVTYNIATDNGVIVGYNTVKIDNKWYAIDYKKSVIINNKINGSDYQYFTHYYFLNNSSELSYLNSTTISWPQSNTANANMNYFENFDTTTGNCKLIASDIDSITNIVTYCAYNNKYAMEVQLDMSYSSFTSLVSLAKFMGYMKDCKYFSYNDATVFVKITL